jgi:hypothetical protein
LGGAHRGDRRAGLLGHLVTVLVNQVLGSFIAVLKAALQH